MATKKKAKSRITRRALKVKATRAKTMPGRKSKLKVRRAEPEPLKRKRHHPSPPSDSRKKGKLSKQAVQELAARKRLYEEQEKLWAAKLNDILSDSYVRQVLIDLAGENTLEIVRNFKGELSDEDLAKKLQLKISDVRATLNRLHNEGLVYYNRQKDSESGWYSYSWMLHKTKLEAWTSKHLQQKSLVNLVGKEDHYFCPACGPKSVLPFEEATENAFRCSECSRNMEFLDEEKMMALARK